jgi:hypothetical protein
MTTVTLCLPVRLPGRDTFYSAGGGLLFFGHSMQLLEHGSYRYIEIQRVEEREAERIALLANVGMSWAAVRAEMGLVPTIEPLQRATGITFRGEHPTAIPEGLVSHPTRVDSSHSTEHAVGPLFISMEEVETHPGIEAAITGSAKLAFELFSSSFYEVSANARFITLTTVMEILAVKGRSPRKSEKIQQYSIDVATKLSKPNPADYGVKAGELYRKRNNLVHNGKSVTSKDVLELRQLAQLGLMYEAQYPFRWRLPPHAP